MTTLLSLLLRRLPLLWILFTANALIPSATWGYDAQPQPSIVYDGVLLSAFDYDSASASFANEKNNQAERRCDAFGDFVKFLAAKGTPSLDALSQAAAAADRGGLTAAGRSLTKHGAGARPGNTLFPAAKGNPATINQTAQNLVDDILTTPGSTLQNGYKGRFGPTIEVTAPGGRGVVYDANGKFLFFKE